jgi:DNA-binding response OmpR family regulator
MTPGYIENKFGKFGKPTVKQQLIISNKKREDIIRDGGLIIADSDLPKEILACNDETIGEDVSIKDEPNKILPIKTIDERITDKLVGEKLDVSLSTKQRGQQLERMVAYQLGYKDMQDGLEGGYPDIRNQMLEVKVQDSPTIDLGKYSPQFEERISDNFTTRTIRYLIVLTNAMDGAIDGLIMCPGEELGKHFTYVAEKSFKCQRSIPMSFFDEFKGAWCLIPDVLRFNKLEAMGVWNLNQSKEGWPMYSVFVLEDDLELNQGICASLQKGGYRVLSARTCKEGREIVSRHSFDLGILDVNLPDGDGFTFCKWLKARRDVPVLFLSARDLEEDVLNGYELGADDYVTKPFSVKILLKKISVVLSRKTGGQNVYDDGFLQIDFETGAVRSGRKDCLLTPTEYRILKKLVEHKGQLLTYSVLLDSLWEEGVQFSDKHALAVNINRLRKKIENEEHVYISNVYGMGYIWK